MIDYRVAAARQWCLDEGLVFEDCQVEADETVIRKGRVYKTLPIGEKRHIGTIHHSIIGLTQRGSTKTVVYMAEPHVVPVDAKGKPSPPSLPTTHLVLPLLTKHFGKFVMLRTDGAEAYRSAREHLKKEGYKVAQDSVIPAAVNTQLLAAMILEGCRVGGLQLCRRRSP